MSSKRKSHYRRNLQYVFLMKWIGYFSGKGGWRGGLKGDEEEGEEDEEEVKSRRGRSRDE